MVCSKAFAKQKEKPLSSVKSMKELTHLDCSKNLPLIQRWYRLQYKKQIKISHLHSIGNVETMVAAFKAGLGLGVIPIDLLTNPGLEKELHIITTEAKSLYNPLLLIQESNYINNTLMKRFLKTLKEALH